MQERSDEQLMTAVQAGDQVAFAALVTRHHDPLLGYLYRLVGSDRPLAEDLVQETLLLHLEDREPSPEERALAAEQGCEVREALAQLRGEYRVVLLLRFYQGFSLQEIAETLHIPLGTVKSRLSVGVHRLRSVLTPVPKGVD
jgi:DNA-directed RNA polymerase specialized sigma24 family protein